MESRLTHQTIQNTKKKLQIYATLLQMIGPQRKISLTYLVDLITGGYLLYLSSQNNELYFLILALVISISSPYIFSDRSSVQSYLFRQILTKYLFDNVEGFNKILMILFLLPNGIFSFVILDVADILLHSIQWLFYVICCRSLQILSEQLGMDRMNRDEFKRQRSIGQLMFESLPQFYFKMGCKSTFISYCLICVKV